MIHLNLANEDSAVAKTKSLFTTQQKSYIWLKKTND
jgi:hypothetical protein